MFGPSMYHFRIGQEIGRTYGSLRSDAAGLSRNGFWGCNLFSLGCSKISKTTCCQKFCETLWIRTLPPNSRQTFLARGRDDYATSLGTVCNYALWWGFDYWSTQRFSSIILVPIIQHTLRLRDLLQFTSLIYPGFPIHFQYLTFCWSAFLL